MLIWTAQWFAHDLWKALLHLGLTMLVALATFGWAALAQAIQPPTFRLRLWRPGFERWDRMSQRGLLRGDGLALVGARRHLFARPEILRADTGHALLLGAAVHTDDALLAAAANWHGALVFIEARDLASRLPRQDVLRFAPGRSDAIAINPLLGVRGGAHAWSDALNLARGFLRSEDDMLVAGLAALALDTLTHAKPEARSLSGMRHALADPQRRLAEFCARWAERAESDLGPATGELTRIARYWRRDGEAALKTMRDIGIGSTTRLLKALMPISSLGVSQSIWGRAGSSGATISAILQTRSLAPALIGRMAHARGLRCSTHCRTRACRPTRHQSSITTSNGTTRPRISFSGALFSPRKTCHSARAVTPSFSA